MEEQYYADRARLQGLLRDKPTGTIHEQMEQTGRSRSWVKKWRKRLQAVPPEDEQVLHGLSRARHHPPMSISPFVVEQILNIRDNPPGNLQRIPGPKAILYYLHQDAALSVLDHVPKAASTVGRILKQYGRIPVKQRPKHELLERPAPMVNWQIDFKDISSVQPDPNGDGKRQHVVESLNLVDVGTSMVVDYQVHQDFNAETVLEAVAESLQKCGLPAMVTFDRDPRFVGSWTGQDFPAAWVRFWQCLGVRVNICPPHRPDKNAFVERYHRAFQEECLAVHRPANYEQACQVTEQFVKHYNEERPNQALSCANRPPKVAFPQLPQRPMPPSQVNPDAWLTALDKQVFVRRVTKNGTAKLNNHAYYIKQTLAGQMVSLKMDAIQQQLIVLYQGQPLKHVPIHGLHHRLLSFSDYVQLIAQEAHQEWRWRFKAG
jgi:transposase InsO family protein